MGDQISVLNLKTSGKRLTRYLICASAVVAVLGSAFLTYLYGPRVINEFNFDSNKKKIGSLIKAGEYQEAKNILDTAVRRRFIRNSDSKEAILSNLYSTDVRRTYLDIINDALKDRDFVKADKAIKQARLTAKLPKARLKPFMDALDEIHPEKLMEEAESTLTPELRLSLLTKVEAGYHYLGREHRKVHLLTIETILEKIYEIRKESFNKIQTIPITEAISELAKYLSTHAEEKGKAKKDSGILEQIVYESTENIRKGMSRQFPNKTYAKRMLWDYISHGREVIDIFDSEAAKTFVENSGDGMFMHVRDIVLNKKTKTDQTTLDRIEMLSELSSRHKLNFESEIGKFYVIAAEKEAVNSDISLKCLDYAKSHLGKMTKKNKLVYSIRIAKRYESLAGKQEGNYALELLSLAKRSYYEAGLKDINTEVYSLNKKMKDAQKKTAEIQVKETKARLEQKLGK
jgi:hypothetical protein